MDVTYSVSRGMVASTPAYSPDNLFNKTQSKYTNLTNQGLWHPSDKTPEEQTLAMVAQQQDQNKKASSLTLKGKSNAKAQTLKTSDIDKKMPPFASKSGKLGNTKQWNGKTYYYCLANHKYSHWHTHKAEDCNTYKKMKKKE